MTVGLYILYALVQAILIARYGFDAEERDGPVFMVVMMSIFAPLVSVAAAGFGIHFSIKWLVTYGKK